MAAVPFFLPLPPFSVSSRLYGGWITCAWSFRVICFPNLFGAQKCYSNFSSVNRNIVSYCISLCIARKNVTGYFTPSWSVLYIKWFENRQTIQEIVWGTLKQFLMFCHFVRFSDEYALECWRISSVGSPREFSIYFYSVHCEACVISFLLLAHRSHLVIFRLHLIFRLSSIKSLC